MAINTILSIFLPKDKIFYNLFEQTAENVTLMGKLLKDFVYEGDPAKRLQLSKDIEDLEHKNDEVTHNIFTELGKNFITPFDREEIQNLAEIIMQGSQEVGKAVMQLRELKRPEKIMESLVKINSLENHADNVFDMSIKNLFDNENDFKNLIRRREVYTVMEVATDKCEDVANVIETIIVKYA